jgi:hypothetical protein
VTNDFVAQYRVNNLYNPEGRVPSLIDLFDKKTLRELSLEKFTPDNKMPPLSSLFHFNDGKIRHLDSEPGGAFQFYSLLEQEPTDRNHTIGVTKLDVPLALIDFAHWRHLFSKLSAQPSGDNDAVAAQPPKQQNKVHSVATMMNLQNCRDVIKEFAESIPSILALVEDDKPAGEETCSDVMEEFTESIPSSLALVEDDKPIDVV